MNWEGLNLVWKISGPRKGMEFESPVFLMYEIEIQIAEDSIDAIDPLADVIRKMSKEMAEEVDREIMRDLAALGKLTI